MVTNRKYWELYLQKATPNKALIALNSHPPKYLAEKVKYCSPSKKARFKWWNGEHGGLLRRIRVNYHIWVSREDSHQHEICWDPVKSWSGCGYQGWGYPEVLLPDDKAWKETYETWCGPVQSNHLPRMSLKVNQMFATHSYTYPILGNCIFCNWAIWSIRVNLKVKGLMKPEVSKTLKIREIPCYMTWDLQENM